MAIVMRQWMLGRKASCEALAQNPRKNKFLQVNLTSGRGGVGLRPPGANSLANREINREFWWTSRIYPSNWQMECVRQHSKIESFRPFAAGMVDIPHLPL